MADQSSGLVWLFLVGRDGPFRLIRVVCLNFSIIINKIEKLVGVDQSARLIWVILVSRVGRFGLKNVFKKY